MTTKSNKNQIEQFKAWVQENPGFFDSVRARVEHAVSMGEEMTPELVGAAMQHAHESHIALCQEVLENKTEKAHSMRQKIAMSVWEKANEKK